MFDNLIESRPKRQRSLTQMVISLAVHALIIFVAIKATTTVAETVARPVDTTMSFIKAPEPPPPPPPPPQQDVIVSSNPPPKGFQTVVAPTDIPKDIPPVDLKQKAFDPRDFTGKGMEGGIGSGVVGGTGPVNVGSVVIQANEATDPPVLLSAGPQRVPPGMNGVPARVALSFIIDTLGHPEPGSIRVSHSTNALFNGPAVDMISKSVYRPGKNDGRLVRVQVSQNVVFAGQ